MILVTGATGNIGGELVKQLVDAGQQVRALVRHENPIGLPEGVELALGDLNKPETVAGALKGVRGVFLLGGYQDMPKALAEMRQAGVQHVVLQSSRSVIDGDPTNAVVKIWMDSEEVVKASGVPWTILQPSGFMSNALRWLPQLRAGDTVRVQFPNAAIASIDPYDIAAVAAVALTEEGHASQSYAITGPESLLPADQVRILAGVLGRTLHAEPQSDSETREELSKSLPPDSVEGFFRFFAKGEFDDSSVLPTVQEVTGRPPRTFKQWAQAHVDDFR